MNQVGPKKSCLMRQLATEKICSEPTFAVGITSWCVTVFVSVYQKRDFRITGIDRLLGS